MPTLHRAPGLTWNCRNLRDEVGRRLPVWVTIFRVTPQLEREPLSQTNVSMAQRKSPVSDARAGVVGGALQFTAVGVHQIAVGRARRPPARLLGNRPGARPESPAIGSCDAVLPSLVAENVTRMHLTSGKRPEVCDFWRQIGPRDMRR